MWPKPTCYLKSVLIPNFAKKLIVWKKNAYIDIVYKFSCKAYYY